MAHPDNAKGGTLILHLSHGGDLTGSLRAVCEAFPGTAAPAAGEALAASLGFGACAELLSELDADPGDVSRPVSGEAFAASLAGDARGLPLLAILVKSAPFRLEGETRSEGILAAAAQAVKSARDALLREAGGYEEGVGLRGFSLGIGFRGGNAFSARAAFSENPEIGILVREGQDQGFLRRLFGLEIGAVREAAARAITSGPPEFGPAAVLGGVSAQVWEHAVVYTVRDGSGAGSSRVTVVLEGDTFFDISRALFRVPHPFDGNPQAVAVIRSIVPVPVDGTIPPVPASH